MLTSVSGEIKKIFSLLISTKLLFITQKILFYF